MPLLDQNLIFGDCLEVLPKIKQKVDMVMADPPYGTTACKWDSVIPLKPMWDQLKRVIKKNGAIVMTSGEPFTSALIMSKPKWFKYRWVWDRVYGPTGHLNAKKMPMRRTEEVSVFYQAQPTYNPQMTTGKPVSHSGTGDASKRSGVVGSNDYVKTVNQTSRYPIDILHFPKVQTRHGRLHPTQKPVALMEYLIKTYTDEGDTVLDFTMGSGTTGVACNNLNRRFIGIENNKEYYDIAVERCGF